MLVLHDTTRRELDSFVEQPSHALLLIAPSGAGKATVARFLASQLLGIAENTLHAHPYLRHIRPNKNKALSIEDVRTVIQFLTRKTTGTTPITRLVIIEDGQLLTLQAQNALLKTIEEPPLGTCLILTAANELNILPTIRSRAQRIILQPPDASALSKHFEQAGHSSQAISKAFLMSGGLPGLMHALLETDTEHPLMAAATQARQILQKSTFERLALIDELAQKRDTLLDVLAILAQMATVTIHQSSQDTAKVRKWQKILAASHHATAQVLKNAQPKLVLLNFMLALQGV